MICRFLFDANVAKLLSAIPPKSMTRVVESLRGFLAVSAPWLRLLPKQGNRYDQVSPWVGLDENFQVSGKYLISIECPSTDNCRLVNTRRDTKRYSLVSVRHSTDSHNVVTLWLRFYRVARFGSYVTSQPASVGENCSRRIACKDDVKKRPLNNSMSKPRLEPHKADGRTMNVDRCRKTLKSAIN